ncbi:MAG: serine protein kinase PrkA, partial [Desulfobulbaceae bacterium]|nr:serine protein kinase PrkA [Desulfobulbaceae bacterium]
MSNLREAMNKLCRGLSEEEQHPPIPFEEYVKLLVNDPIRQIRNVFQAFYDMIHFYIGEGEDEYPDDPESIHYVDYDCYKLFVEELDHPFFADRLFANRLVNLVEALRVGAQQNKIYVFEGPHGSGKSTFLNNLLLKFENYVNSEEGTRYETVWRFKRKGLGPMFDNGKD